MDQQLLQQCFPDRVVRPPKPPGKRRHCNDDDAYRVNGKRARGNHTQTDEVGTPLVGASTQDFPAEINVTHGRLLKVVNSVLQIHWMTMNKVGSLYLYACVTY